MSQNLVPRTGCTDYETPQWLFDWANEEWGPFTLDICATAENTKCRSYITPDVDALRPDVPWEGCCWMNPPYSRTEKIEPWIKKAYEQSTAWYSRICCLLPAKTDTKWFHLIVLEFAQEIVFLRGRINFVGGAGRPVDGHMIVVFDNEETHCGNELVVRGHALEIIQEEYS